MRYELTDTISELLGEQIVERGANAMVLCPFHDEDTPSFSIHLDTAQWQCFGCGKHGGLEKLARLLGEELNESTRQDILIRSLDLDPPSRTNFAPLANGYIQALQTEQGQRALRDYVGSRPISMAVAEHFGLGYNPQKGSLAIPYWNDGFVAGIKYRARDGFKYSEDKSVFTLYAVDGVRGRPVVVLGEGESDTHALWTALQLGETGKSEREQPSLGRQGDRPDASGGPGLHYGVGGTSGAVESERLWKLFALDLLFARKVFLCYDADSAGDRGFKVAQRELGDKVIRIRPTKGKDMTEHILAGGTLDELGLAKANLRV